MKLLKKSLIASSIAIVLSINLFAQDTYTVETRTLKEALEIISEKSKLSYIANESLLQNKKAPSIKNVEGLEETLKILLKGSGLKAIIKHNTILIKKKKVKSDSSDSTSLGEVDVIENTSNITESTNSYTLKSMSTATKLNLSPRETPQTIKIMTNQLIEDFSLTNMEKILESTPGIHTYKNGNRDNYNYTSRGYKLQTQYDGIPDSLGLGDLNGMVDVDSVILDHVEIQQGAAGLLSGSGQPGGTVNMIRKMPKSQFSSSVDISTGSWNTHKLSADITGAMNEDGSIRARLVVSHQENESFVDYVQAKKDVIYGVIEADISDTSTISGGIYIHNIYDTVADNNYGVVIMNTDGKILNIPRSTYQGADWSYNDKLNHSYFIKYNQELSSGWNFKSALTYNRIKQDILTVWSSDVVGQNFELWPMGYSHDKVSTGLDIYASGPVQLFGREHEIVLGLNGSRSKTKKDSNKFYGDWSSSGFGPYDVKTYAASAIPNFYELSSFISRPEDEKETSNLGVYLTGRFNITDSFKTILGFRNSSYEYKESGKTGQKESNVVTPYAGLIYDMNEFSSIYTSYSEIFEPKDISVKNVSGQTLDPTLGKNYEAGIKAEFFNGSLNTSASIFKLEQENLSENDGVYDIANLCGGQCYKEGGLVVSKGFDIGISGQIYDNIQLMMGYNYVNHKYASGENDGKKYSLITPEKTFKFSTSYTQDKWKIGGNLRYQSKIQSTYPEFNIKQKAYTVVGLMGKYKINKNSKVSLNINNIFDKTYYAGIDYGSVVYGDPRNFTFKYSYNF